MILLSATRTTVVECRDSSCLWPRNHSGAQRRAARWRVALLGALSLRRGDREDLKERRPGIGRASTAPVGNLPLAASTHVPAADTAEEERGNNRSSWFWSPNLTITGDIGSRDTRPTRDGRSAHSRAEAARGASGHPAAREPHLDHEAAAVRRQDTITRAVEATRLRARTATATKSSSTPGRRRSAPSASWAHAMNCSNRNCVNRTRPQAFADTADGSTERIQVQRQFSRLPRTGSAGVCAKRNVRTRKEADRTIAAVASARPGSAPSYVSSVARALVPLKLSIR